MKWVVGERVMLQMCGGPWRPDTVGSFSEDDRDLGCCPKVTAGYYGPTHQPYCDHIGRYPTQEELQEHWPDDVLEF